MDITNSGDLEALIKSTAHELLAIATKSINGIVRRENDSVLESNKINGTTIAGFASVSDDFADLGFFSDIIGANEKENQKPTVRISGITVVTPDENTEIYNSITINFDASEESVNEILLSGKPVETNDIKEIIDKTTTTLRDVRSSNQSSFDSATDTRTGKFYNIELPMNDVQIRDIEMTVNESGIERPSHLSELSNSLNEVLATLEKASRR